VLGWVIGWSSAPGTPRCAPGRWKVAVVAEGGSPRRGDADPS
jgi:hypothetical protein